nr:Auxin-induced protein like [Ipomoea batatas]GME20954.1 Auxin-induced protein like [Ipomoea batatas]
MRPVLFISLLLLSTLLYEAQGRHLRRGGDLPARNHRTNENGSIRSGEKKIDACKDGQCSSSSSASAGKNRKLIAKTTSSTYSTTTTSKKLKNEGTKANPIPKKENFSVNSSPETGHRETSNEHYPNVFDLAGMDYSPARRKAPIHN